MMHSAKIRFRWFLRGHEARTIWDIKELAPACLRPSPTGSDQGIHLFERQVGIPKISEDFARFHAVVDHSQMAWRRIADHFSPNNECNGVLDYFSC